MYKVTVEHITTENYVEHQNFITKKTPTSERKPKDYGNGTEVIFAEECEVREIPKQREITRTVLKQEIRDEDTFNLAAVIRAINNL